MDNERGPFAVEREAPPEDNARKSKASRISLLLIIVITAAFAIGTLVVYLKPDKHYSVAIDSASVVVDSRPGVSFNLTLGVASRSLGAKACIGPGTYVEVLYRGVKVAASNPAETRQTCARPRKEAAELPVVARATVMPVGLMVGLAAEMAQRAAVFDMRWIVPVSGTPYELVSGCNASQVGDPAVPCASPTYTRLLSR
jgi:hypothetical protein